MNTPTRTTTLSINLTLKTTLHSDAEFCRCEVVVDGAAHADGVDAPLAVLDAERRDGRWFKRAVFGFGALPPVVREVAEAEVAAALGVGE